MLTCRIRKLLKARTAMGTQGRLVPESVFPFTIPCTEITALGAHSWVQPAVVFGKPEELGRTGEQFSVWKTVLMKYNGRTGLACEGRRRAGGARQDLGRLASVHVHAGNCLP